MDRNSVYSVRIFFIDPVNLISVIMNSLIELEYEAYSIDSDIKDKLFDVFKESPRNVIFFSIRSKVDIEAIFKYIEKINEYKDSMVQMGAFTFDSIDLDIKNRLLENGVSVITFETIQANTVEVIKDILLSFEAKGKRSFIRTSVIGDCKANFYIKNKEDAVICPIKDISAYAFSCEITDVYRYIFTPGEYIADVLIVLRGLRIRTSVKVVGFSENESGLFILKFCTSKIQGGKLVFEEKNSPENTRKVHEYIRKTIQELMINRLTGNGDSDKKDTAAIKSAVAENTENKTAES